MDNPNSSNRPVEKPLHVVAELNDILLQAQAIGPQTAAYIEKLINHVRFREPMLAGCRGILRLARLCGNDRIEAACCRALKGRKYNLTVIKSILDNHLDEQSEIPPETYSDPTDHENLRGDQFFK
jgi:hypothetical protein